MDLSTGQVADKICLSGWKLYLSRTTGQPLMSHPDMCGSFLFIYFYLHSVVNDFGMCVVAKVYFLGMCWWCVYGLIPSY